MPRHPFAGETRRHLIALPPERHEALPFIVDLLSRRLIAPWPRKRPQPGDEERLDELLAMLDLAELPADVCWAWIDRDPIPVTGTGPNWLANWARGRAIYKLQQARRAA